MAVIMMMTVKKTNKQCVFRMDGEFECVSACRECVFMFVELVCLCLCLLGRYVCVCAHVFVCDYVYVQVCFSVCCTRISVLRVYFCVVRLFMCVAIVCVYV